MDASGGFDDWAAFYDAHLGDFDMGDVEFYRDFAAAVDGPVLEIGCGTGRIYLELLRDGIDVHGIDVSGRMLDALRTKAADAGLSPSVERADMRTFDLDREFALAVVPFRAFLHNLTVDDQLAALERIHAHLAPGGQLGLNFFVPDPDIIAGYGTNEETIEIEGAAHTLEDRTTYEDPVEGIVRIDRTLRDPSGAAVHEATLRISLVTKTEFELLLRLSPFSDWEVYGGFHGRPLEDVDQEMVWIADR